MAETSSEEESVVSSEIINGTDVPAGKWPDALAVLGTDGVCTGTLIAPTVVLTAGHCQSIGAERVIVGASDYRVDGKTFAIASFTAHAANPASDVAVIVLSEPVEHVQPRRIAKNCTYDGFVAGTQVQLVGFGRTDEERTADSQLREARVTVSDPDCMGGRGCDPALAPGGEFVAGGDTTNSCFGDSGGPVYLDTPRGTVLIGSVSRGISGAPGSCSGGAIYARVDKIAAWIESTARVTLEADDCDEPEFLAGDAPDEPAGCATGSRAGSSALLVVLAALLGLRARRARGRASPRR